MINLHTVLAKDIASKVKPEDKATHPAPSELEQIHAKRTSLCSDGECSVPWVRHIRSDVTQR